MLVIIAISIEMPLNIRLH